MSGIFRKKENQPSNIIDQLESNPFFQFHRNYWQFDQKEKEQLMNKYPDDLTPAELMRLHHLNCLEHISSERGKAQFGEDVSEEELFWPEGKSKDLCAAIIEKLLEKENPYRPRPGLVWQGEAGVSDKREPDLEGIFYSASLTHLGCFEAIRIDDQKLPKEIAFIPIDEISGVVFDRTSFYRVAKIFYDSARDDEVVFVPLIYGLSWHFEQPYLHDGSFTQWGCLIESKQGLPLGIGLGHQDFKVVDGKGRQHLVGLGSIGEFIIPLDIKDPRFEEKCRARGLDPGDFKKQIE